MAKVTAPLLGFGASGQIGKTQVYGSWKGVPYARRHVIPANPNSTAQQVVRGTFKWLSGVWKVAGAGMHAAFAAYAKGKPLTDRNAFVKSNLAAMQTNGNVTVYVTSPGANGGLAASAISAANSAGNVTVTLTAPTLPSGWAITNRYAQAVIAQDPNTSVSYATHEAVGAGNATAPRIDGLGSGTYTIAGFLEYTKDDGSIAYGPSSNTTVTV